MGDVLNRMRGSRFRREARVCIVTRNAVVVRVAKILAQVRSICTCSAERTMVPNRRLASQVWNPTMD